LVEFRPPDPYNRFKWTEAVFGSHFLAKGWKMEVVNTGKKGKKSKDQEDNGGMFDIIAFIEKCTSEEDLSPWEGTLRQYLPMVQEDPSLADASHARLWRMIETAGVRFDDKDERKEHPEYNFFTPELFGINDTLASVMEYFKAAAAGSDVSRRILLLYGPTSSGKSQFAILLKEGLERFSRTKAGRIYALKDCPMHESPLNAVPKAAREQLKKQHGIAIEGDLCPRCAYRLKTEFNNDFLALPVERILLSEANRVGIGTFQPADPKSQNQSELTGSVNFAKLAELGSESHPMAFDFNGELNKANRGMMEFIEFLKVDRKFRHILLTLAQEKRIKAQNFPLIFADLVVLSHTNETEYLKFLAQKEEEALHDRLWVVKFPYNLRLDDEIKIYEKLISRATGFQGIHIAPHTLRLAAMFAILSRLEEPKDQKFTLLTKMRLYNGEKIDGAGREDEKKLREVAEREGMDGISPRYIVNRISACFTKYGRTYITPMDIVRSIKEGFSTNAKLTKDDINRFENIITTVMEEYNKIACNEVQKAFFLNFEHEIKGLLNNYIDNVGAYLDDDKVKNDWGELEEPNHRLMRSVEEKIRVTDGGKDAFHQEVYRKMIKSKSETGGYDYQSHPRLKEALQKQLFEERSDIIRLTVSVRNPDPEALKRLNEVIKTLSEQCGYTPESANDLLRYVSSIMSKNN
jgi:serine protein kinase